MGLWGVARVESNRPSLLQAMDYWRKADAVMLAKIISIKIAYAYQDVNMRLLPSFFWLRNKNSLATTSTFQREVLDM